MAGQVGGHVTQVNRAPAHATTTRLKLRHGANLDQIIRCGPWIVYGPKAEKQLAIGEEQEFVRISGVVNPSFVDFSNSVDSSKVADARIEYKSAGQISDGQIMGWMARFFLNVLPF